MSKKIKERTKELKGEEARLKKKLVGKSNNLTSKATKVGKTALIGGIVVLILYSIYKLFIEDDKKKGKKTKEKASGSNVVTERLTAFLLPYLGKILDNFFEKRTKKEEPKEEKESNKES